MNSEDYVKNVLVTEARDFAPVIKRLQDGNMPMVVHSSLTQIANTGRTVDALKRGAFYGKEPKNQMLLTGEIRIDELSVIQTNLGETPKVRLLHSVAGMATETGEIAEITANALDGAEIDRDHLIEELGDLMWYIGVACDVINVPLAEVQARNISKLRERYTDGKFTEQAALNRDLEKEKAAFAKTQ